MGGLELACPQDTWTTTRTTMRPSPSRPSRRSTEGRGLQKRNQSTQVTLTPTLAEVGSWKKLKEVDLPAPAGVDLGPALAAANPGPDPSASPSQDREVNLAVGVRATSRDQRPIKNRFWILSFCMPAK